MFEAIHSTRVGYVNIVRTPTGKIEFTGLPVLGYGAQGYVNRKVHIWPQAPAWFVKFCDEYAGTDLKVKVQVVQTPGRDLALATPVAIDAEEALYEWGLRKPVPASKSEVRAHSAHAYVCMVHTRFAELNGLQIVEHHEDGMSSYSIATNTKGETVRICGGKIVYKVKEVIDQRRTTLDNEIGKFVRMKLVKTTSA